MNVNRQQLHDLIDIVDAKEFELLYRLLIKFIPEDAAELDEIEAIRTGRKSLQQEDYVRHEDIDWN